MIGCIVNLHADFIYQKISCNFCFNLIFMSSFGKGRNMYLNRQTNLSYDITHTCYNVQNSLILTKNTIHINFFKAKLI